MREAYDGLLRGTLSSNFYKSRLRGTLTREKLMRGAHEDHQMAFNGSTLLIALTISHCSIGNRSALSFANFSIQTNPPGDLRMNSAHSCHVFPILNQLSMMLRRLSRKFIDND